MSSKGNRVVRIIQDIEDAIIRGSRREIDPVEDAGAGMGTEIQAPLRESPAPEVAPRLESPQNKPTNPPEPVETKRNDPPSGMPKPRVQALDELSGRVRSCEKCSLCITRINAVPGMGPLHPLVLVVGEGPGADEDRHGLPFVGKAGQYLDQWLKAIHLYRQENVYITNVIKCRPPENRDPHPEEISACISYLEEQVEILKPRAVLTVGRISSSVLLGEGHRMADIHGRLFEYRGIPVVPTYHPAAVLRNRDLRRTVWQDLQVLHQHLFSRGLLPALPGRGDHG